MSYRRVFKYPRYALLLAGMWFSRLSFNFAHLGVAWFIYRETGQAGGVAAYIFFLSCASAAVAFLSSLVIDRVSPKTLLALDGAVRALLFPTIVLTGIAGRTAARGMWPLALALGALFMLSEITARAFIPDLLPGELLATGNALSSVCFELAAVIGPLAAGIMATVTAPISLVHVAAACSVPYSLCIFRIAGVFAPARATSELPSRSPNPLAGLAFVLRDPVILSISIGLFVLNVAMVSLAAVMPSLADRFFRVGSAGYGLMMSTSSAGALLGGAAVGLFKPPSRLERLPGAILAAQGIVMVLLGLAPTFASFLGLLFLSGLLLGPTDVFATTVRQVRSPARARAQILAVSMALAKAGSIAGGAALPFLLTVVSVRAALGIAGAVTAAAGGLIIAAAATRGPGSPVSRPPPSSPAPWPPPQA